MRQQYVHVACRVRRQTRKHVSDVRVRIVSVELGRLDQTHEGRGALARHQRADEQPVLPARGPGPGLLLVEVVGAGSSR